MSFPDWQIEDKSEPETEERIKERFEILDL